MKSLLWQQRSSEPLQCFMWASCNALRLSLTLPYCCPSGNQQRMFSFNKEKKKMQLKLSLSKWLLFIGNFFNCNLLNEFFNLSFYLKGLFTKYLHQHK